MIWSRAVLDFPNVSMYLGREPGLKPTLIVAKLCKLSSSCDALEPQKDLFPQAYTEENDAVKPWIILIPAE